MSIQLLLQHLENNPHTQYLIRLITHQWQVTCLCSAVTPTSVTRVLSTPCAADLTGQYVRHLLEPAFCSVPTAAEIPALFQTALHISGTLPFPVPDVFYESQRRQDGDMKHYLGPVSQSAAVKFGSKLHDVLTKSFPAGTKMVQAGLFLAYIFRICLLGLVCNIHGQFLCFVIGFELTHVACQHFVAKFMRRTSDAGM